MRVMPSIRRRYYADYIDATPTKTLLLIRDDLMKDNSRLWDGSWESKRLARVNQVLKSRNQLPKP